MRTNAAKASFTTTISLLNTCTIIQNGLQEIQAPAIVNTTYGPNVIGNEEDFSYRDVVY